MLQSARTLAIFCLFASAFIWCTYFPSLCVAQSSMVGTGIAATPLPPPSIAPSSIPSPSLQQSGWQKAKSVLDVIESILKIAILLGGTIWGYYKFIKGRVFKTRLEIKVTGKLVTTRKGDYVLATIQIKNPGMSQVEIDQKGTAILIYPLINLMMDEDNRDEWGEPKGFSVLKNHHWIEPGESLEENILLPFPETKPDILKLRLRVNSQKTTWETVTVVEASQRDKNQQPIKAAR